MNYKSLLKTIPDNTPDNTMNVFNCICSGGRISRRDIAELISLSVMTVGKITDILEDAGLVRDAKQLNVSPGRRAAVFFPCPRYYSVVISIAASRCSICVHDLALNEKESASRNIDGSAFRMTL